MLEHLKLKGGVGVLEFFFFFFLGKLVKVSERVIV